MIFKEYRDDYDLLENITPIGLDTLELLENYLDYAIHTTIIKQLPDIDDENEKFWAKEILTGYIKEGTNSFTSKYNIRSNMNDIDLRDIIHIFMKNSIEYMVYKELVLREEEIYPEEHVVSLIYDKLNYNEYDSALKIITTNPQYKKALIRNYITFKYGKHNKDKIYMLASCGKSEKGLTALKNLEFHISDSSKVEGRL